MGQSERSLSILGRHVADLQDRAKEARLDRERGRARLLAAKLPAHLQALRGPRPAIRLVAPMAAALLLAAFAAVLVMRPSAPLRFELGTTGAGVAGAWIAAPPADALPIRFSDGSLLRLAAGGRARVASVSADGAEIALERGALDVWVVHRAGARWTVRVGPFEVHVIGTRFETSWDPVTERFGVALREGAITVSGPVVGDARAVRAGETLTVSPATNTLQVGSIYDAVAPAPDTPAPSVEPPAAVAPEPSASPPSPPASSAPPAPSRRPFGELPASRGQTLADRAAPPSPAPPDVPGWRALAVEARYKDALAAAEREGFDAICNTASASELHALGDAARLGGSGARAAQAFTALRKRFPGSPEAAAAAFIMGRVAVDQREDYAMAAAWFTRYLSEQPRGPFAAEAAGRLVEARDKMGDEPGARRAAERYLAAYPDGSHAAYAKGVIARAAAQAP